MFYPSQGHAHVSAGEAERFKYNSDPPTSGPHREIFTSSFISPQPIPVWVQVHLLEHGNVLLQYKCRCPQIEAALSAIANGYDSKLLPPGHLQPLAGDVQNAEEQGLAVIVAPYPRMRSPVALSAWTRLATLQRADATSINGFIRYNLHNDVNLRQ